LQLPPANRVPSVKLIPNVGNQSATFMKG
jgi:hypothetical protein